MKKTVSLMFLLTTLPSVGWADALTLLEVLTTKLQQAKMQKDQPNIDIFGREVAELLVNGQTTTPKNQPTYDGQPLGNIKGKTYGFRKGTPEETKRMMEILRVLAATGIDPTTLVTAMPIKNVDKNIIDSHRTALQKLYGDMKTEADQNPLKKLIDASTPKENASYAKSAYSGRVYVLKGITLDYSSLQNDYLWIKTFIFIDPKARLETNIPEKLAEPTLQAFQDKIKNSSLFTAWVNQSPYADRFTANHNAALQIIADANIAGFSKEAQDLYTKAEKSYGSPPLTEYSRPLSIEGLTDTQKLFQPAFVDDYINNFEELLPTMNHKIVYTSIKKKENKKVLLINEVNDMRQDPIYLNTDKNILDKLSTLPLKFVEWLAHRSQKAYNELEKRYNASHEVQFYVRIKRISMIRIKQDMEAYQQQQKFVTENSLQLKEILLEDHKVALPDLNKVPKAIVNVLITSAEPAKFIGAVDLCLKVINDETNIFRGPLLLQLAQDIFDIHNTNSYYQKNKNKLPLSNATNDLAERIRSSWDGINEQDPEYLQKWLKRADYIAQTLIPDVLKALKSHHGSAV